MKSKRRWPWIPVLALAPAVLSLAGCAADNRAASTAPDPLLGNAPPTPIQAGPPRAATASAAALPSVPPVPVPTSSGSTAALASTSPSLDPTHELRIGNANRPADGQWTGQPPTTTLQRPEPPASLVSQTGVTMGGAMPPAAAAGTIQVTSFDQGLALLQARGISWYQLQTVGSQGEVKFSCSVPNPQNRNVNRTYEAQGRDYLSAIRAVVEQIYRDH